MKNRAELNQLVVKTLEVSNIPYRATELYEKIREQPIGLKELHVKSFKGFVKILNAFPNVKAQGIGVKVYMLKKIR